MRMRIKWYFEILYTFFLLPVIRSFQVVEYNHVFYVIMSLYNWCSKMLNTISQIHFLRIMIEFHVIHWGFKTCFLDIIEHDLGVWVENVLTKIKYVFMIWILNLIKSSDHRSLQVECNARILRAKDKL